MILDGHEACSSWSWGRRAVVACGPADMDGARSTGEERGGRPVRRESATGTARGGHVRTRSAHPSRSDVGWVAFPQVAETACDTTRYTPAVRAVDLHVHLPLPEWVEGSMGP